MVEHARDIALAEIRVDGVAVVDQLAENEELASLGAPVVDMQAGAAAVDSEHFLNARAEWYWDLRQRFEDGSIDLEPDDDLAARLGRRIPSTPPAGGPDRVDAEMRKRGLPLPDRADADATPR